MTAAIRQYLIITGNYWAFTLTDGALRMLVVLHFYQLGYSPLEIALLFIFYEFFGVVTNLVGGYLGARMGLNRTMNIGLFLQIVALGMLAVPAAISGTRRPAREPCKGRTCTQDSSPISCKNASTSRAPDIAGPARRLRLNINVNNQVPRRLVIELTALEVTANLAISSVGP